MDKIENLKLVNGAIADTIKRLQDYELDIKGTNKEIEKLIEKIANWD